MAMALRFVPVFLLSFLTIPAMAAEFHFRGSLEPELQGFFEDANDEDRKKVNASLSGQFVFDVFSDDGRHHFAIEPFGRVDWRDDERTHADLRQAKYELVLGRLELMVGLDKVYWGVTEAVHLVDVINQTDAVDGADGEDKLGQPMIRASYESGWGTLTLYGMPLFRERTFPGRHGRPRIDFVIDPDRTRYEHADENEHFDWAMRYFHYIGPFEIGLSYFDGTAREPVMEPIIFRNGEEFTGLACPPTAEGLLNSAAVANDCLLILSEGTGLPLGGEVGEIDVKLAPFYPLMRQASIDLQAVFGSWLFKLEALQRKQLDDDYVLATGGVEYSLYGLFDSEVDLGMIAEYVWDERGSDALNPFQNDLFLGARWGLNDVASTAILMGGAVDLGNGATILSMEAERRIGDDIKISLEARGFASVPDDDPLAFLEDEGFAQMRIAYFF